MMPKRRYGDIIPAFILLLQISRTASQLDPTYEEENVGPCANFRVGDDDLQAYDFITKYRLDFLESKFPGVSRVRGSNRLQTAFRLEKEADLTLPTRDIFPQGLPEEFSLICTYRTRRWPKIPYHLVRVTDLQFRPQFLITLNPTNQTVEFSIPNYEGRLQTLVFPYAEIFDKNWHKIHFGVSRDRVMLYIDCVKVGQQFIEPKGPIDVNGEISLSKVQDTRQTVPVEIQWMVMSCDPTAPDRERCNEIPKIPSRLVTTSRPAEATKPCTTVCPRGQPGLNGTQGLPGSPGPEGPQGIQGFPGTQGPKGERGEIGIAGQPGLPGPIGLPGPRGLTGSIGLQGQQGSDGPKGDRGEKGEQGEKGESGRDGIPGQPGVQGLPGPRGPPGYTVNGSGDSIPGPPGPRGLPGIQGPQGIIGPIGARGPQGPQGLPGNDGINGEIGPRGFKGERGEQGERGFPGLPGSPGQPGSNIGGGNVISIPGPPGPRGDAGFPGSKGVLSFFSVFPHSFKYLPSVISSDAELDAKLELFKSINDSCVQLQRFIDLYKERLCYLAQEEHTLGRYLKECGKTEKNDSASKIMITAGKSLSYIGHQRLTVRAPLVRLHHEVDTFTGRAVVDTKVTVDEMEKCRTEYRAALSWMKSASQQLDPDTGHGVDKFRKAQSYVRSTKNKFDKYTLACLQKVDLLAAARCNMFSHALIPYINALSVFSTKATEVLTTAGINLDKVEPYDFHVTAELAIPNDDKDKQTFFNAEYSDKNEEPSKEEKDTDKTSKTQTDEDDVMNLLGEDFSLQAPSTNSSELSSKVQTNEALLDLSELENGSNLSKDFFMPSNLMQGGFNFTSDDLKKLENTATNGDLQKNDTSKQDAQVSWLSLFEELDPLSNKNSANRMGDQL